VHRAFSSSPLNTGRLTETPKEIMERPPVVNDKSSVVRDLLAGVALFCILVACIVVYLVWRDATREALRARDLPVTVTRAAPIIAAIKRFERDHRKPPATLQALIPRYLNRLPGPGPVAEKGWNYEAGDPGDSGGWSLSVDVRDKYSPNIFGFGDTFVYRPSEEYPNLGYGGGLRKFGRWGYYVE
jgi:hypothetical protein